MDAVVADEVRETRAVVAEAPPGGGGRRGRRRGSEGEGGAEQGRSAQELTPGHALGVEVFGGDGRIGPDGQVPLGRGRVESPGRQWFMNWETGSARSTIRTSPSHPWWIWSILPPYS